MIPSKRSCPTGLTKEYEGNIKITVTKLSQRATIYLYTAFDLGGRPANSVFLTKALSDESLAIINYGPLCGMIHYNYIYTNIVYTYNLMVIVDPYGWLYIGT